RHLRARRDDRVHSAAVRRLRLRVAAGGIGVEGKRESLGVQVDPDRLRVRDLNGHQLLRGAEVEGRTAPAHPDGGGPGSHVEERVLTTTLDSAVAWARGNSFFPLAFGLACCAMEQFQTAGPRMDIARFGFEAFRASPRQADLIILAGRVSIKMAPIIRRLYDQMLEPKWAISVGGCCSSMGGFDNYALFPADSCMPRDSQ